MFITDKRAIVTGASKGIGRAIAESLAREGARLFLTARARNRLTELKNELDPEGGRVEFEPADLSDANQLSSMFDAAMEFLGGVDILVNNAGLGIESDVVDMSSRDWDTTMSVNLRAVFQLSKLTAIRMIPQQSGYIINIGSGASQTPYAGFAAYCASKFGLLGFSESLGMELRDKNIKVSIILPGSTATFFGGGDPPKKIESKPGILRPSDVADSVLFLLRQSDIAWTSVMNLRPLNPARGAR